MEIIDLTIEWESKMDYPAIAASEKVKLQLSSFELMQIAAATKLLKLHKFRMIEIEVENVQYFDDEGEKIDYKAGVQAVRVFEPENPDCALFVQHEEDSSMQFESNAFFPKELSKKEKPVKRMDVRPLI